MATTKQAKKTSAKKTTVKKTTAKKTAAKSSSNKIEAVVQDMIDNAKTNIEQAQANAKRTWLLGLGVIGRSSDTINERLNKITEERQKLMKELVSRGEKVQDEASDRIKESRNNLEEKLEEVKNRYGKVSSVKDLSAMLQEVSEKLQSYSKNWKKAA